MVLHSWVAFALCVCSAAGGSRPSSGIGNKPTLASLGPNFQWNCQTAAHKGQWQAHKGNCAKLNRSIATYDLIDELDIGVVTDFLPDDAARQILEKMKVLPDDEWTQIDNKQARAFGRNKKAYKASVEMDYKMYDLQLESHQEMRKVIEPLFAPYFKGENQQLSLFLGKYSHGSYVTTHTDGAVVTLNGQDRYDRKRAFLLYLNADWKEEDGGLFTDEEDTGHPHYTPGWNTLLTFRVPRWHLVTPVRAQRTRWSIYGWSLDARPSEWEQFVTFVTTKPLHVLGIILAIIGALALLSKVAPDPPPKKD